MKSTLQKTLKRINLICLIFYSLYSLGQSGPLSTNVQTSQCGATLATINQPIYANLVTGAQGYRFKITDLISNQVQIKDKLLRTVVITTDFTGFKFNNPYKIEVLVKYNNVWQTTYGLPCTVSTPATTTMIQSSQSGSTLITMDDVISANNVAFATGYRFRITNNSITPAQVQIIDRNVRNFKMSLLAERLFDTTYTIEVAVKNTDGTYLPYGQVSEITTPSFPETQIQSSQCMNFYPTTYSELIYADAYTGASMYRFRITSPYNETFERIVDKSLRTVSLNQFTGLNHCTDYIMEVSLKIGSVFGPYGSACTFITPGECPTRLMSNKIIENEFSAIASPNPFSDNYKIKVNSNNNEKLQIKVYNIIGQQVDELTLDNSDLENYEFGKNYNSGVYNVIISQALQSTTMRIIKR